MISIWAVLYPNSQITITANNINTFRRKILKFCKNWTNNRVQARRIAKNLVEHDQLFSYMPNESLEKAFSRTKIIDFKGKKMIIIPTKSYEVSNLAKEELDDHSISMLIKYYPNCHWSLAKLKKIPYTNYYITLITEK